MLYKPTLNISSVHLENAHPCKNKGCGGGTLRIKKDCVMIKGGSVRAMTEKEGLQPLRSGGNEK